MDKHSKHDPEQQKEMDTIQTNKENDSINRDQANQALTSHESDDEKSAYFSLHAQIEDSANADVVSATDTNETTEQRLNETDHAVTEDAAMSDVSDSGPSDTMNKQLHTEQESLLSKHDEEATVGSDPDEHRFPTHESNVEDTFDYQKFHEKLVQIVGEPDQSLVHPSADSSDEVKYKHEAMIQAEETTARKDETVADFDASADDIRDNRETAAKEEQLSQGETAKETEPLSDGVTSSKRSSPLSHPYWDYGLSILLLAISAFFAYRMYALSILSFDWLWKLLAILIVLNGLIALTLIRKWHLCIVWVRRVAVLLLCALLTYGTIFANTLQESLEAITQPETATTINVSLITKKDGGAKQLEELSGKKIGIQTANDKENSTYVKEQLSKERALKNVTYVEDIEYEGLYRQLTEGKIDALIITDYYFKTLLKENHPAIEDDIFILKSYQKKKETKLSENNKDIRYEPFTVYIAGVDEGDDPGMDARSDVNIVLMVNPLANHIEMVSIPRDSFVPNPALGNASDKLTHLGLNGVENSMLGLEQVLGFEIDYYVKLNFFSVIDIIDAIGEIEVDVPVSFCEQDEYRSFAENDLICLNEGVQKVNGKQALAFARHRKSYTDVMRGKAQQEVIKGTINQLTSTAGVININNVLKIASKAVSTNMPMEQVTNFVSAQLDNLKPWTIDSIVLENGADAMLVTASMPSQELYVMLLNPADIQSVFDAYQAMLQQMQFSHFTFHLDHLEDQINELPYNPYMVWAGSDVSAHRLPETTQPTPAEEQPQPEIPNEETPNPNEPQEPSDPNEKDPNTPDKPSDVDDPNETPNTPPEENQPQDPQPDKQPDNSQTQDREHKQ